MATASPRTYECRVKGVKMICHEELEEHNVYEPLFLDDATLFFLHYKSDIKYDPGDDALLEKAFMGDVQAFKSHAGEATDSIPLIVACHCGHLPLVQYICDKGDSVNAVSVKGITPLFAAAAEGHIQVMSWLLQRRADVNTQEENGCHPLLVSAFQGRADMVKLLLRYRATVDQADNYGRTALMAAAQQGHVIVVDILLQHRATVDVATHSGSTAVVYAAMANQCKVLEMLHKYDPDVFRSYGSNGITLMSHVCRHGNLDMVKVMHDLDQTLLDQKDREGRTALMAATEGGHEDIVRYLVDNGASVNVTTTAGMQVLTISILEESWAITSILLPEVNNVDVKDKYGNTPLLLAAKIGHLPTVKSLIQSAANVNHQNLLGFTPLMVASKQGHLDVIECLIEHHMDKDKKTVNNLSAIDIAYLYKNFDIVSLLRRAFNQDVSCHLPLFVAVLGDVTVMKQLWKDNIQSVINDKTSVEQYGVTCLMVASYLGNVEMAGFLLRKEVSTTTTTIQNPHGFTALEYALVGKHHNVADLLTGYGLGLGLSRDGYSLIHASAMAGCEDLISFQLLLGPQSVNSKTTDFLTPLMIASQQGMLDTVKLLIDQGATLLDKSKDGLTAREYAFVNDNHGVARYLEEVEVQQKARKESDTPMQSHFERFLLDLQLRQQLQTGIPAVIPSLAANISPFMQACIADDRETAERLYREGCDVHIRDADGENALTMACERGSTRLAEWLIVECKISSNSANFENTTALMVASKEGHFGCANVLLDHHAVINAKDTKTFKSAMHLAAHNNHTHILELLLNHKALIDIEDCEQFTPLSLACLRGNIEAVEILINWKADVEHKDRMGRTAVLTAARNGHLRVLELLVQHNARLDQITYHGKTAMSYAMNSGHHEVVAWIETQNNASHAKNLSVMLPKTVPQLSPVSSSADVAVLISSAVNGTTEPNSEVGKFCHIQGEVDCPLCYEGVINSLVVEECPSWTYKSIPFACVRNRHMLRLITLLNEGFEVDYQNNEGLTLLMLAASLGILDIVAILLEHGADVKMKNYQGHDPLTMALDAQHFDVAELLADRMEDTMDSDVVMLKIWPGEENEADLPLCRETHNTADDVSLQLYQKINEKWNLMFDECYKVVTMVIQRDCPADIHHVYRSWQESVLYVHTRNNGLDPARDYFSEKILKLLPCAKFIQVNYIPGQEGSDQATMLPLKNPVEYFHRQLALNNQQLATRKRNEEGVDTTANAEYVIGDVKVIPFDCGGQQEDGSRPNAEVHTQSGKELLGIEVVIQDCASAASIVMTDIISQYRPAASPTNTNTRTAVFFPDTFTVALKDYTGNVNGLNGCLIYLASSNRAFGFVLGHVPCLRVPEFKYSDINSVLLLCMKVNEEMTV